MYHVSAQGVDECTINVHYYYAQHDPLFNAMQVSCMQVCTLSMSRWFHMYKDTHHYQSPVSLYVYNNTIHYQCQFSRFVVCCCCCHVCNDTTHYQCQVCFFTCRTHLVTNAMFMYGHDSLSMPCLFSYMHGNVIHS